MHPTRIYQPGPYTLHDQVDLLESASHHVGRVLRMRVGEALTLFSGDNREFSASITAIRKLKKLHVTVRIEGVSTVNRESPCKIHLAQGVAKGDHMSFVVQKAVELGVASITPLFTQYTSVKQDAKQLAKKHAQWEAIAISACEQSGRNVVPTIHPVMHFAEYLETCQHKHQYLLDPAADHTWQAFDKPFLGDIKLLIGPEGGLSPDEVLKAEEKKFQGISLGPRILRTETATLTALSVLQAFAGDL